MYLSNKQYNWGGGWGGFSGRSRFNRSYKFAQNRGGGGSDQGRENSTIIIALRYGITHKHTRYLKCNKNGHFTNQFSHQQETNTICVNYIQYISYAEDKKYLNFSYILNDSCSTSIVTNNLEMITNVRDGVKNEIIKITTNGRGMKFDKIGRFK